MRGVFKGFPGEERVYRALRVDFFKKLVPLGDYWLLLIRSMKPGFRIVGGRQSALVWTIFTLCVEALHGLALLAMLAFACAALLDGDVGSAAITTALNILINAYPIMVQRYNRIRLVRAFKIGPTDLRNLEIGG